jgi:hypothetical protein
MAREFKETAHLKTNLNAYSEGWERIFQKMKEGAESNKAQAGINLCDCHNHHHQVCDICQGVTGDEQDQE